MVKRLVPHPARIWCRLAISLSQHTRAVASNAESRGLSSSKPERPLVWAGRSSFPPAVDFPRLGVSALSTSEAGPAACAG